MAGNSLLNASMITKESVRVLKNTINFAKNVNRTYDDSFANKELKIGSVINIRKPVRFNITTGAALTIQDVVDQYVPLTIDTQKHVGFQFSSKERTLNIEQFSQRYITPAMITLGNQIDFDGLTRYQDIYNSVGTPGTPPATALVTLQAGQKLSEFGAPIPDRTIMLNPAGEASMVNGLSSIFNQSKDLVKQYETGYMATALGFNWKMDQNVQSRTVGALGGTPTVKVASVDGDSTLSTQAWTAAAAARLKKGDIFTISSVNAVNPQTRTSTGSLQQFTVTADFSSDASGNGVISISPTIQSTGQYQNVDSLPQIGAALTIVGAANTVTPQNLAFHKDAFALAMVDLVVPDGVDMAARTSDEDSGFSIRMVRNFDINNDRFPCRLDVAYGWKTIYAELACRIQG